MEGSSLVNDVKNSIKRPSESICTDRRLIVLSSVKGRNRKGSEIEDILTKIEDNF